MGIFSWFKWTKVLVSAEDKFRDIYNFELEDNLKVYNRVLPLAFTMVFEEMRINKVLPDDAMKILRTLRKDSPFYVFITPVGRNLVQWNEYKRVYANYLNERKAGLRPILSYMFSISEQVSDKEREEIIKEYQIKPIYGSYV